MNDACECYGKLASVVGAYGRQALSRGVGYVWGVSTNVETMFLRLLE